MISKYLSFEVQVHCFYSKLIFQCFILLSWKCSLCYNKVYVKWQIQVNATFIILSQSYLIMKWIEAPLNSVPHSYALQNPLVIKVIVPCKDSFGDSLAVWLQTQAFFSDSSLINYGYKYSYANQVTSYWSTAVLWQGDSCITPS